MKMLALLVLVLAVLLMLGPMPGAGQATPNCKSFMGCDCPCPGGGKCIAKAHTVGNDDHFDVQCRRCNQFEVKKGKLKGNWSLYWWCPSANAFIQR